MPVGLALATVALACLLDSWDSPRWARQRPRCKRRNASRPDAEIKVGHLRRCLRARALVRDPAFDPPGRAFQVEHLPVVQDAIDHRRGQTDILDEARRFGPTLLYANNRSAAFVAAGDQLVDRG